MIMNSRAGYFLSGASGSPVTNALSLLLLKWPCHTCTVVVDRSTAFSFDSHHLSYNVLSSKREKFPGSILLNSPRHKPLTWALNSADITTGQFKVRRFASCFEPPPWRTALQPASQTRPTYTPNPRTASTTRGEVLAPSVQSAARLTGRDETRRGWLVCNVIHNSIVRSLPGG
ncbi:hypothetical protein DFP72DRAFT_262221 [Ephemerocybe angulata]|uniref:Uncharacterized protein n=1 Tax=Ephemerocybe angulata TaxID=980116 RepID=A0A8H6M6Q0_9AGAR|nr:hypothetical protein DFP72DRAFT_262221 [Tulosesus angulatus]